MNTSQSLVQATAPYWYESQAELDRAVSDLKKLGPAAKRLLGQAVQESRLENRTCTKTVEALYDSGFIHVSEPDFWSKKVTIKASLWGEEALDALEAQETRQ